MPHKKKPKDWTRSDAWMETLGRFIKSPKQTHLFYRRSLTMAAEERQKIRKYLVELWSEQKGGLKSHGFSKNLKREAFIFSGKQGKGEKKAMIVTANAKSFGTEYHCWAYYPKPADAMKFASAIQTVANDSPTRNFPGSVGVILGQVYENRTEIDYLQGSFSQRKAPNLTRGLVSKYMGWREQTLNHIFQDAINKGKQQVALKGNYQFVKNLDEKSRRQAKIFLKIAKRHGFKRKKGRGLELIAERKI